MKQELLELPDKKGLSSDNLFWPRFLFFVKSGPINRG